MFLSQVVSTCCQLILEIAENILTNPGDEKFTRVKRTGARVKSLIMELEGTVELMVEVSHVSVW